MPGHHRTEKMLDPRGASFCRDNGDSSSRGPILRAAVVFGFKVFSRRGSTTLFFLKNDIFETKLLFLCGDTRSRPVGRFGSSRRVSGMRQTRDGSTRDPTGRARRFVRIVRRTWPTVDAWRTRRSKGDNRVAGRWPRAGQHGQTEGGDAKWHNVSPITRPNGAERASFVHGSESIEPCTANEGNENRAWPNNGQRGVTARVQCVACTIRYHHVANIGHAAQCDPHRLP